MNKGGLVWSSESESTREDHWILDFFKILQNWKSTTLRWVTSSYCEPNLDTIQVQFDHQEAIKQPIGCIKRPPTLQMISKFVSIYFQKYPLTSLRVTKNSITEPKFYPLQRCIYSKIYLKFFRGGKVNTKVYSCSLLNHFPIRWKKVFENIERLKWIGTVREQTNKTNKLQEALD